MQLFDTKELTTKNGWEKWANDFQTPQPVGRYMASLVPKWGVTVLEPTPGEGKLVAELSEYDVTAPTDYFLLKPQRFDCVVMNPPFSAKYANLENAPGGMEAKGMKLGYKILLDCMKMSDNVIALMPWFTISDSDVRLRHLKRYGLKSITALPRKTFQYARVQTMVLELQKEWAKPTEFKVFDLI